MIEQPVLPIVAEISDALWEAVADGQPVVLTRAGQPAAVVMDWDSYQECEDATDVADREG